MSEEKALEVVKSKEQIYEKISVRKIPFGVLVSGVTPNACEICLNITEGHFFVTPFYIDFPVNDILVRSVDNTWHYYYYNWIEKPFIHRSKLNQIHT